MTTPVKPEQAPHILTGDEWAAAQYGPHRLGNDPTQPMSAGRILTGEEWDRAKRVASLDALKFPALPKPTFTSDATKRLNPNAGPVDRSIPEQLGGKIRHIAAGFDAAAMGLGGTAGAGADVTAASLRQAVAPAVEHPLLTAALASPVGAVIGTGMAIHTIAQYGWQKAHELGMSPEDRAKAEADPNRVSGEAAAVQALMLGLGAAAGIRSLRGDVSAGMMESGAQGVKTAGLEPQFTTEGAAAGLSREVESHVAGEEAALAAQAREAGDRAAAIVVRMKADRGTAEKVAQDAAELRQEQLTQQAALRALTGIRRRPKVDLTSSDGAQVLGETAAQKGLPETASPYPPQTPLDVSWKEGHAAATQAFPEGFAMGGTEGRIPEVPRQKLPRTESQEQPQIPFTPVAGPTYKGPVSLYGRLSDDALAAEYRAVIEKRTALEPEAMAPLWTPEREAEAVAQIENRRRPDGSLAPIDKRRLATLQAAQGEGYNVGRHTFESAAADQQLTALNKHVTAIEKEMAGRGLKPEDALQAPAAGGGGLTPLEGTGKTVTRGLARSVERRAIAQDLTNYLGDLPDYRRMNMEDQAARASNLMERNPALAHRIALGETPPPADILPEAVFKAVEKKALAEGDIETLRDLAKGGLSEQATTMGQRIRLLGERDPESPVAAIQKIEETRGGGRGASKAVASEVTKLGKSEIPIDQSALAKFIESMRCP